MLRSTSAWAHAARTCPLRAYAANTARWRGFVTWGNLGGLASGTIAHLRHVPLPPRWRGVEEPARSSEGPMQPGTTRRRDMATYDATIVPQNPTAKKPSGQAPTPPRLPPSPPPGLSGPPGWCTAPHALTHDPLHVGPEHLDVEPHRRCPARGQADGTPRGAGQVPPMRRPAVGDIVDCKAVAGGQDGRGGACPCEQPSGPLPWVIAVFEQRL